MVPIGELIAKKFLQYLLKLVYQLCVYSQLQRSQLVVTIFMKKLGQLLADYLCTFEINQLFKILFIQNLPLQLWQLAIYLQLPTWSCLTASCSYILTLSLVPLFLDITSTPNNIFRLAVNFPPFTAVANYQLQLASSYLPKH